MTNVDSAEGVIVVDLGIVFGSWKRNGSRQRWSGHDGLKDVPEDGLVVVFKERLAVRILLRIRVVEAKVEPAAIACLVVDSQKTSKSGSPCRQSLAGYAVLSVFIFWRTFSWST